MRMRSVFIVFLLFYFIFLSNCFWIKAKYDPQGHQNAVSIENEALELMAKAEESYDRYSDRVYLLMSRVEEAYEHSRLYKKNEAITGLWDSIRDPNGKRLGKFMEDWRKEDKLSKEYIDNNIEWAKAEFKLIIQLEEKKKK